MTAKAGKKGTAIRRAIVPRRHLDAVAAKLKARLAKTVIGDPAREDVRMGALASQSQRAGFAPVGERVAEGAFFAPTLLLARDPHNSPAHDVEAFGPVSTLMTYDDIDEALHLAARGRGSLVGTVVTKSPAVAAKAI